MSAIPEFSKKEKKKDTIRYFGVGTKPDYGWFVAFPKIYKKWIY